ncbi:MAG TPA: ATP-dependent zinc metalloprotease FtsH [Actinomycetota bacterium]|nr:ATP-dependent zinc metalloprotease FtsH [Actinomycetota bacterium]
MRRVRRAYKNWRLRQRRGRVTNRRSFGRRKAILLSLLLVLLLAGFAWGQSYLTPETVGVELSLDELTALGFQHRLETATFLDEDNLLVGSFAPRPLEAFREEPKKNKDTRAEGRGKDERNQDDAEGADEPTEDGNQAAGGGADGRDKKKKPKLTPREQAILAQQRFLESKAPPGAGTYWLSYPSSDAAFGTLAEMVTEAGAEVSIDPQTDKAVVRTITTYLLPLLILASFFGLLFSAGRGGGSGIGEIMTFGTIGKKRQRRGYLAPVTFGDVAGADEAVAELREVVDYLSDPERYEDIGAVPPKGVLLFGPPGCGKTLLAKAVAGEAGVPFFNVAGAEFVESLVGVGAARVRDLFQRVRAVAPAIVFIDELDAAGRKRGHGGSSGGGSDEREQTLNQLLVEMDGFEVSAGIVVIGATNRPDIIDPALIRPGRFDRHITVDQPDVVGRRLILELHARGKPIADDVDFELLARRTPGFSGADLANVINEAALLTVRDQRVLIEMPELDEAVQRVLHGPKRRGRVLSPDERTRAAYHESGHAIVAAAVGGGSDVHRVTILARGKGLGITGIQRESDRVLLTRSHLSAQLITAMGGLAAEELIFGEPSTGAESDLEHATELARDMVARFGMSPALGRVRLLAPEAEQYLGGDIGLTQLSADIHAELDAEIARLLEEAESEALRILGDRRKLLDEMASRLEVEESLEGVELDLLIRAVPPDDSDFGYRLYRGSGNGPSPNGGTKVKKQRAARKSSSGRSTS